jgi:hypothetical protein
MTEPEKSTRREITFGLREAVILAVVAIASACAYVYYHLT